MDCSFDHPVGESQGQEPETRQEYSEHSGEEEDLASRRRRTAEWWESHMHWPSIQLGWQKEGFDIWAFADTGEESCRLRVIPSDDYRLPAMPLGRESGIAWLTQYLRIPLLRLYETWQNHAPWSREQVELQERLGIPLVLQDRLTDAAEVRDDVRHVISWVGSSKSDPSIDHLPEADWIQAQVSRCSRDSQEPLPTFAGEDIQLRCHACEHRLRGLKEALSEVHLEIVVAAKNRYEAEGNEPIRGQLLEQMRAANARRRVLQSEWDELRPMYENLMFLTAVGLLYSI
ncbi:hypothetical protein VKT23_020036 [Stygiomarasmius scandens]|uniref:Uncharacterized protein n=1 Tax=Marasmiellus scandens TaxID=2682957 RepID=A0ABR1IN21_9AGAR